MRNPDIARDQIDQCHARPGDMCDDNGYVPFFGALKNPAFVFTPEAVERDHEEMLVKRKACWERAKLAPPKPPDPKKKKKLQSFPNISSLSTSY